MSNASTQRRPVTYADPDPWLAPPRPPSSAQAVADEPRERGTVKWFNADKGYGFITPEAEAGDDIFVHANSVRGPHETLGEGDLVNYRRGLNRGGRVRAEDVRVEREKAR